ncbi:helix-turn-helix domain-containing protein [uncultured Thiohalocapsa sp.]|uniref:helix-turn-helix domain-containing protein n=1 Tax=uncultured Thiohalocapsa sp. TaxID=768990 RepID=UPI0025FDCA98|nr:helix-turn-helix domain-containing protein [uncultured Thiohalocapsa sp.]
MPSKPATPETANAPDTSAPGGIDHPPAEFPARKAYPVEEARGLLGGISRKSIYDLINAGELRSVLIAGRRLIPADAIDELIRSAGQQPPRAA